MKIQELKVANLHYTITELCTVFELSSSTYYDQIAKKPYTQKNEEAIKAIKQIAKDTKLSYGRRRIQKQLESQQITIGIYKTATLMKAANVIAIKPTKKHYYPNGGLSDTKAENILNREFKQPKANSHWVADITYIWSHQGWSYLACVLDLGTKEIVGWSLSKHPNTKLVIAALTNAIKRKNPNLRKLLHHSDQGTQYTANTFIDYCDNLHITRSMSRRGNCWDNAVMERFFRSLKTERLNHLSFINHEAVIAEVESYIYFYNYKRLHSAIDYMTPNQKFTELQKVS